MRLSDLTARAAAAAPSVPMMPHNVNIFLLMPRKLTSSPLLKSTSGLPLAAVTEAAANSEDAAQTTAAYQSFTDSWTSVLEQIGANQVRVGKSQKHCIRTTRKARVSNNPQMKILKRQRNRARRQNDGQRVRQLDRQIYSLVRALENKENIKHKRYYYNNGRMTAAAFGKLLKTAKVLLSTAQLSCTRTAKTYWVVNKKRCL